MVSKVGFTLPPMFSIVTAKAWAPLTDFIFEMHGYRLTG